MIKTEYLNDNTFIKHYSDAGVMLLQNETGVMYADPVDLMPCKYTYSETDVLIEIVEEEIEKNEEKAE
jgi:hypothetical protein